tara:strand:- start:10662 stop:10901 length:240 start_codon:yes stop_codon:yes gene_type:complete
MPIFLRFKEKLKKKLRSNIRGHFEYPTNVREFTEVFNDFVQNGDLSIYMNAYEQILGIPLALTEKITELKEYISKKQFY